MRFRFAAPMIIAVLICAALAAPATAQTARQQQQQQQQQQQTRVGGEAWYAAQLVELSEVLGGSHYLRILCEGRGDQRWRDYMRNVLVREPQHNDALVEGFNRGYRQEESRFPDCNRSAQEWEVELRARGRRIADGLSARHAE